MRDKRHKYSLPSQQGLRANLGATGIDTFWRGNDFARNTIFPSEADFPVPASVLPKILAKESSMGKPRRRFGMSRRSIDWAKPQGIPFRQKGIAFPYVPL
jgi:hypothetical protein